MNDGPGDQTDAHVSGDLATYTDQSTFSSIRYFTFPEGPDLPIPSVAHGDFLLVFDTASSTITEVAASTTAHRFARQSATARWRLWT